MSGDGKTGLPSLYTVVVVHERSDHPQTALHELDQGLLIVGQLLRRWWELRIIGVHTTHVAAQRRPLAF